MCPEAVLLLPSTESKTPGGRPGSRYEAARADSRTNRFRDLDSARGEVLAAVTKFVEGADEDDVERTLDAKGATLRHAVDSFLLMPDAPVLPAVERYAGAMFKTLAYAEMPSRAQEGFQERAVFVSGAFGALAPGDLIPDYRLRMDVEIPGVGVLADYWRPRLGGALANLVRGRVVWNLLPEAHAAAWPPSPESAGEIAVRFIERRNGRLRSSGHWSKSLTGAFARHLATRGWGLQSAEKFESEGYRLDASLSNVEDARGEMVFVKG